MTTINIRSAERSRRVPLHAPIDTLGQLRIALDGGGRA